MLLLAAADTIAGVAQTASKVTCTIFGMELNTGTEAYKVLAQLQLAAAVATIYTAPASTQAFVRSIAAVNTDLVNSQTFQLFRGGTAAANAITPAILLPAGGSAHYEDGFGWNVYNAAGQLQTTIVASRANLPADAKGWQFLGFSTGATTTVGPVIWTGTFSELEIKYWIAGYNGGTPVGRALLGAAAISTTALTNSFALSEGVTAPSTGLGATAIPGCPLAVTLSNIGRGGIIRVDGASGAVKELIIQGRNVTPAVASAPTLFRGASFFSDLGTNLPIQRAQLTVYDTLTAVAVSAQTFTAGTYLIVRGRNQD